MIEITLALLLGLAIGSFLNVCVVRIPHKESVVRPGSRCPACAHAIAWYDNIPVVSYLILAGRCRNCRGPISIRYPIVESLTALVSVLIVLRYGFGGTWAIYLAFSGAMIVLVLIDLDHRVLPDVITLNGIWLGLAASLYVAQPIGIPTGLARIVGSGSPGGVGAGVLGSLAGAIFGGGLLWLVREAFFLIRGIEGMGFGDVKMMAMIGAFLGVPLTFLTILLGSMGGALVGIALIRFVGKSRRYELPFGTFLGIGAVIALLYGNDIVQAYVDHFFPRIV